MKPNVERKPRDRNRGASKGVVALAGCSLSGYVVKILKHRGASVPSYYVAIFDTKGECTVLLASDDVGWWTKADAKAASAGWLREHAKPTENAEISHDRERKIL